MASSDIDPTFRRALRLLHLKSKDAEEQLRMMLDDAIKQRYGNEKTLTNYLSNKESSSKRDSPGQTSSGNGWREDLRDTDMKNHEQLNEDDASDSSWESSGAKKKSGNNIKKSTHSKKLLGSSILSAPENLPLTSTREMDDHEEEEDNNDLALEILKDDLACVVCRGMDIGARNQMIECVECKSLYHQECHQPPVTHTEITHSRLTWYCANCREATNNRGASSNNLEKHTSGLNLTGITAPQPADMKLTLDTSGTKSSSSSTTSSSKSCEGLLQASAKPLSSSSFSKSVVSAASSSKPVIPNINIMNTEKKPQIAKKKNKKKTARQQEKKKHSK